MRKTIFLIPLAALLASGCSNLNTGASNGLGKVESKFGRGLSNSYEILRGGELSRSMEQTALFDGPDASYTVGFVRGVNRTLVRTGIGLYEVVTAPFPPYHPVFTNCFAAQPVYTDGYKPDLVEDSIYATDTYVGFAGGDTAPWIPGSRFQIFETH